MSKNDDKIVLLQKKLIEKFAEIKEPLGYKYCTNLQFNGLGRTANLNTIGTPEEALEWRVWLNSYCKSAKDLGFEPNSIMISNFSLQDWLDDLEFIYKKRLYKRKKEEYDAIEMKLNSLLSNDKKVELELESIGDLLNG
jgi:hypothetical protein